MSTTILTLRFGVRSIATSPLANKRTAVTSSEQWKLVITEEAGHLGLNRVVCKAERLSGLYGGSEVVISYLAPKREIVLRAAESPGAVARQRVESSWEIGSLSFCGD